MITLLSLKREITKEECFKHLEFPFVAKEEYSKLRIKYSYFPKDYLGEDGFDLALNAFKEAYGDSLVDIEKVKNELPLKNHITLSLSKEGELIGTAHRHANNLVVEVSQLGSTPGFYLVPINKGNYSVVLSVHALLCEKVTAEVEVVAYE